MALGADFLPIIEVFFANYHSITAPFPFIAILFTRNWYNRLKSGHSTKEFCVTSIKASLSRLVYLLAIELVTEWADWLITFLFFSFHGLELLPCSVLELIMELKIVIGTSVERLCPRRAAHHRAWRTYINDLCGIRFRNSSIQKEK